MESLKNKSRLITVIVTIVIAVLTYVATMQPESLAAYLPHGYESLSALIIVIAAAIVKIGLGLLFSFRGVNIINGLAFCFEIVDNSC